MLVIGLKKASSIVRQLLHAVKQYDELPVLATSVKHSHLEAPWCNLLATFKEMLQSALPDLQIFIALLQKAPKTAPHLIPASVDLEASTADIVDGDMKGKSKEFNSDVTAVHILAVLQLCHDLIPNSIYHIRFDYGKLLPVYLKTQAPENCDQGTDSTAILDPLIYLCQSRILNLVGYSASMNHTMPSSTLLTCLLRLSSAPKNLPLSTSGHKSGHVPMSVAHAARRALRMVFQYNVPHLRDAHEEQEIEFWIDALTELRTEEECTPLIGFLDDCIRACLRAPLKYVDDEAHPNLSCEEPCSGPASSILFTALVTKTSTVCKAYPSGAGTNNKTELISQLIKFHNTYLLCALSAPHKLLPLTRIQEISTRLQQIFSHVQISDEGLLSTCVYLGPMILEILQCPDDFHKIDERLKFHKLTWPSYLQSGIFFRQLITLDFLHRKYIWPRVEKIRGKQKKGVLMVEFGEYLSQPNITESASLSRKEQNLFFMTRVLESHNLQSTLLSPHSDTSLNYARVEVVIGLITDYLDDDASLIAAFVADDDVWNVVERAMHEEKGDLFSS